MTTSEKKTLEGKGAPAAQYSHCPRKFRSSGRAFFFFSTPKKTEQVSKTRIVPPCPALVGVLRFPGRNGTVESRDPKHHQPC